MKVSFSNWKSASSHFGLLRSVELQAVDQQVKACAQSTSKPTLKKLARAILDWQESKGNWATSHRAQEIMALINLVKAQSRIYFQEASGQIFSWMHCEPALQRLRTTPGNFLMFNVLIIHGASSGVKNYCLTRSDDTDATFQESDLTMLAGPTTGRYSFAPHNRGPRLSVYSIPMHTDITLNSSQNDVEGKFEPVQGSSYVLTGRLTGCSFLMRTKNNELECAHIQPSGCTGVQLQGFLEGLNLTGVTVFGAKNYQQSSAVSIFGNRDHNSKWTVRAQEYDRSGMSRVIQVNTIFKS